ncbi:hypothetical protein CFP56_005968 [Quercus suber]|uniref:Uncharacterized protein n=1 Tax=Quercus suber TaxID=58331 RepID=A0AAW0M829_QUESU
MASGFQRKGDSFHPKQSKGNKTKRTKCLNSKVLKSPPQGWVKINFDEAIRPNISMVAIVCRKDNDEILFAHSFSWKS